MCHLCRNISINWNNTFWRQLLLPQWTCLNECGKTWTTELMCAVWSKGTHRVAVNYHTHTCSQFLYQTRYKSSYTLIVIPKYTFLKVFTSFCEDIFFFWKIWRTLLLHQFLLAFYEISICTCTCALTYFLLIIVIIIIVSRKVLAIQACSIFMSVVLSAHSWCMLLLFMFPIHHIMYTIFFFSNNDHSGNIVV